MEIFKPAKGSELEAFVKTPLAELIEVEAWQAVDAGEYESYDQALARTLDFKFENIGDDPQYEGQLRQAATELGFNPDQESFSESF